jgi:isopentenyl diphosphate isomerase/L-lactate dehydrogenase-like FMN-dependent dehydrogenase
MAAGLGCWNIADLRAKARRRLPLGVWEYLERGVEDETGMARNRAALDAITFIPRVARNVENIETSCEILGAPSAAPIAIGPTGAASLMWHNGDVHLARAAAKAGIPFTISSASTMDVEEIAEAGGTLWFQLYMWEDKALSYAVLERAQRIGCETLFVTLDLPVMPNREYLFRNGYGMPFAINRNNMLDVMSHPRWMLGVMGRYALGGTLPTQANLPPHLKSNIMKGSKPGTLFKQNDLDWDAIKVLREKWRGKLVLKGILHPDDAELALGMGADGVIVSNHGARSLDHSIAAIDALPTIADRVGGRMSVLFDSGVRRGSDVVKALALGAEGVMLGRATLYGLGVAGERGVSRALDILQDETRRTMGMLGITNASEIGPQLLAPRAS